MRITYPGHATLLVEGKSSTYMCDPWLVGDHVNNCAVWLYPPRTMGIKDIPKLDFIYVSHEHEDHSNIETLKQLPHDLPVYILKFYNEHKVLLNRLKDCGLTNIHVLEPWETKEINSNTRITIFPSDEGWIDSSACIESDGIAIYHGNDNFVTPENFRRIGAKFNIEMAFLPYAGFSGFPASYEFPAEVRDAFAEKKKREAVEKFFEAVEALNPKVAVPAAGDLSLVGTDIAWVNYYDRCSPDEVYELAKARGLGHRVLAMRPGDAFIPGEGFIPYPKRDEWSYSIADQVRYAQLPHVKETLEKYTAWLHDVSCDNFQEKVTAYFEAGLKRFPKLAEQIGPYVLSLQAEGKLKAEVTVDFANRVVNGHFDPNYTKKMVLPGTVLFRVMRQDFLWSDAYSSCRMVLDRRPADNYNRNFWQWLYSLDGLDFFKQ